LTSKGDKKKNHSNLFIFCLSPAKTLRHPLPVDLMGPDPGSALVSQANPYTTGPFGISPWSAD